MAGKYELIFVLYGTTLYTMGATTARQGSERNERNSLLVSNIEP